MSVKTKTLIVLAVVAAAGVGLLFSALWISDLGPTEKLTATGFAMLVIGTLGLLAVANEAKS